MDPFTTDKAVVLLNLLRAKGIIVDHGLNENETSKVEAAFGTKLPADFKLFLQSGVMKSKQN